MKRTSLILILVLSAVSAFAVTKWVLEKKEHIQSEKETDEPLELPVTMDKYPENRAETEPGPAPVEEPAVAEKAEAEPAPAAAEEAADVTDAAADAEPPAADTAREEPEAENTEEASVEPVSEPVEEPAVAEKAEAEPGPAAVEEAADVPDSVAGAEPPAADTAREKTEAENTEEAADVPAAAADAEPPAVDRSAEPEVIAGSNDELSVEISDGRERIAVLPFDNLTKKSDVITMIMPELKRRLKDRGLHVIDDEVLTDFLCDRRIRPAAHLPRQVSREVARQLKAKTILAGSVVSFGAEEVPSLGIVARLIDASTGKILWADYASVSGHDYSLVFGLGTIKKMKDLVPRAMDELFASFSTEASAEAPGSVHRIAVMPFKNESDYPDAGMITTYMFLVELLKDPDFEPVEYGEIRELCVELRIRNKGGLAYENIKAISGALETHWILIGTVDTYSFGSRASSVPKAGITARLLDARENRILWYNSLQLNGEEDTIAFDWGRIRQVDRLAYKVVTELLDTMRKSKKFK